ncbi:hypothetical protein CC79DRAFT_1397746 [Sarocladium strictum]
MRKKPCPPQNQLAGQTVQVSTPNTDVQPGSNRDVQCTAGGTPAVQKRTYDDQNENSAMPPKKARLDKSLAADVGIAASVNADQGSTPGNHDHASAIAQKTCNKPSQPVRQSDTESEFDSHVSDESPQGQSDQPYIATSIYGFTLGYRVFTWIRRHFFGNQGKEQRSSYDPSKHFRFLQGKYCSAQHVNRPGPGTVAMQNVGYVFGSGPKRYSAYERAPTTQLECGVGENGWLRAYALTTHYIEKNVEFVVGYRVQEGRFDIATVCVENIFFHKESWGQPVPEIGRIEDTKRIVIENIAREVATIKEDAPDANAEATRKAESQLQDSPISTVHNVAPMGQALWHLSTFKAPYQPAIAKYIQVLCRMAMSNADSNRLFSALRELNLTNAEVVEIAEQVNGQKTKAIKSARAQLADITRLFDSTTDLAAAQALNHDATKLLVSSAMCRSMDMLESFMDAQSLCNVLMQLRLKNRKEHEGGHHPTGNEDTAMDEEI